MKILNSSLKVICSSHRKKVLHSYIPGRANQLPIVNEDTHSALFTAISGILSTTNRQSGRHDYYTLVTYPLLANETLGEHNLDRRHYDAIDIIAQQVAQSLGLEYDEFGIFLVGKN